MLCIRCGTYNQPDITSCSNCGTKLSDAPEVSGRNTSSRFNRSKTIKWVFNIGESILNNQYQIDSFLGVGVLTQVYKVRSIETGEILALKLFNISGFNEKDCDSFLESLQNSHSQSFSTLQKVLIFDRHNNMPIVVSPIMAGISLYKMLYKRFKKGSAWEVYEGISFILKVVSSLIKSQKLSSHFALHPGNIYVKPNSMMVTDFGIYSSLPRKYHLELKGKLGDLERYFAPEFFEEGDLDHRADIYSLGVIAYEWVCGKVFEGVNFENVSLPDGPEKEIKVFLEKCLQVDCSARFQSLEEFKYELSKVIKKLSPTVKTPPPPNAKIPTGGELTETFQKLAETGEIKKETKPKREKKLYIAAAAIIILTTIFLSLSSEKEKIIEKQPDLIQVQKEKELEKKKAEEKLKIDKQLKDLEKAKEKAEQRAKEAELEAEEAKKAENAKKLIIKKEKKKKPQKKAKPVKRKAIIPPKKEPCLSGMVYIQSGHFIFGSPQSDDLRNYDEYKSRKINLNAFCIDRYEFPNRPGFLPSTSTNWHQAKKTCEKIGKRLCTEMEWERACKAGSYRRFPYGNKFNADRCNTEDSAGEDRKLAASGRFKKCYSPLGIFDLSGNLAEWVADRYSKHISDKTIKGGSFK